MKASPPVVVPTKREAPEPDGPQGVVHGFEADILAHQRIAEKVDLAAPEKQPLLYTRRTSKWPG